MKCELIFLCYDYVYIADTELLLFKQLQGLVLKGWIYVTSDKQHAVKKSIKYLDEGIQDNTDIFGMMGKVGSLVSLQIH